MKTCCSALYYKLHFINGSKVNVCTVYVNKKTLILVILACLGHLVIHYTHRIHHFSSISLALTSGASRPILEAERSSLLPLRGNPLRLSVLGSVAGVIQSRHQISLREEWRAEGWVSSAAPHPSTPPG